jgi:hypothetical protein
MTPSRVVVGELGTPSPDRSDRSRAEGQPSAAVVSVGPDGGSVGVTSRTSPVDAAAPAQGGAFPGGETPLVHGVATDAGAFAPSTEATTAPAPGAEFTNSPGGVQGACGAECGFDEDCGGWGMATGAFTTPDGRFPDGNFHGGGGGAPWVFGPSVGGAFGGAQ